MGTADRTINGPRPARDIVQDVLSDIKSLFQSEVRLAKAEIAEKAERVKTAGGMLGAAAVTGLFAGMCFLAACIALLALAMPVWAAALIMTVVLAAGAGIFYS